MIYWYLIEHLSQKWLFILILLLEKSTNLLSGIQIYLKISSGKVIKHCDVKIIQI